MAEPQAPAGIPDPADNDRTGAQASVTVRVLALRLGAGGGRLMGSADVSLAFGPEFEIELRGLTVLRLGRRLRVVSSRVTLEGARRATVRLPPSWWQAITQAVEADAAQQPEA
jgi:hypothetical protein